MLHENRLLADDSHENILPYFLENQEKYHKRISSDKASNLPKRDVRFILLK